MADIRQSPSSTSDDKIIFDAESVAGDLWMRQNYHGIHVVMNRQEAEAFTKNVEGVGLILEKITAY